jgi:hypothetical protein
LTFLKALGDFDAQKALEDGLLSPQANEGLNKVFKQLNPGGKKANSFRYSSGAGHQLLDIIDHVKQGNKIVAVEKKTKIANLGDRFYDLEVLFKNTSDIIKYEKKAWKAESINALLTGRMQKNLKSVDGVTEGPGQLFKDLVQLNREKFCCTRWSFDSRATEFVHGGKTGAEGIGSKIVELAKKNQTKLRKEMGFLNTKEGRAQWEQFIKDLKKNQSKIVEVKSI